MTAESKARNPDYSASAVNLVNPPELKKVLEERQSFTGAIANLKALLEAYPEWEELKKAEQRLADHDQHIRTLIDQFGSYQDVQTGEYALKQQRFSTVYLADKVPKVMPEFEKAVLITTVDGKKVDALLKGRLITPDQYAQITVRQPIAPAYIIR